MSDVSRAISSSIGTATAAHSQQSDHTSHSTPTRFVIRDIDVENFKSYAGTHRIGPFHKTFTCVIGPNGSGKSNVIDAMLFVFGKAAKKIRLEKLSELIHSSAAFPDLSYASVTVNFMEVRETKEDADDPTQRLEIPGTELSIKREVHRNNQSQYFINNIRSTQKEVVATLTEKGVDLDHNRFLILQGEVEQISLMKPKAEKEGEEGLLEYLDDLIGTNQYVDSIAQAATAFDQVQEERLNVLDDLRRALADRNALEAAKLTTLNYVTKDNHLQRTLIVLCQLKTQELEKELVGPRKRLEALTQELLAVDAQSKETRENIANLAKDEDAKKKIVKAATTELEAIRSRKLALEEDYEKEKASAEEQEKQRKKEADKIKKAREDIQAHQLQAQSAELDVNLKEQRLQEIKEELAVAEPRYNAVKDELVTKEKPIRVELEKAKQSLLPYARKLQEAVENRSTAVERLRREEDKILRAEKDMETARQDVIKQQQVARDLTDMLARAENDTTAASIQATQAALKLCVAQKLQINQSIEDTKRNFKEGSANDRIANYLLSQRDIKKYFGTLRQLGRIDPSFDIAAGVASNQWGHHVVEDEDTASLVLERLKSSNMGRATIIVLDKVGRRLADRIDKKFQAPPQSERLFDMIQPINEKFRPAFYSAVQDTLVCGDLQTARRIGFGGASGGQRHRVVTRSGELVEPNGTMSAGGQPRPAELNAARAPQDQQAVKDVLSKLQRELQDAVAKENGVREQLVLLEQQNSSVSPEHVRRMKSQLTTANAAVAAAERRIAEIDKQLAQLRDHPAQQELRRKLKERIDEASSIVATCEREQSTFRATVQELGEQLASVGGTEFLELEKSIVAMRARLETDEKGLREAKKVLQKAAATKERKEKELVEAQARLDALRDDNSEQLKEQLLRLQQLVDTAEKERLRQQKVVADAESAVENVKSRITTLEEQLREHNKERDRIEDVRQQEESTISKELVTLGKLTEKLQRAEEHIRDNIRSYGADTYEHQNRVGAIGEEYADMSDDDEGNDTKNPKKRARSEDSSEADDDAPPPRLSHLSASEEDPQQSPQLTEAQITAIVFTISIEKLVNYDYQHSSHLARELSEELKRLEATIDFSAVGRWREKDVIYRRIKESYDTVRTRLDNAELQLNTLKDRRKREFMECFNIIQRNVKEMYQMLTHGGDAEVELVDTQDPFEGVNFLVRPPKKSWKQVSNLSGGEKTLSSLALVFALHHVRPTPVYVMDEIDAALDFRNVSIVANYVLRQATGAQFIIISLRNNMFELAHQLVGICKIRDVTRSLTLNPHAMQQMIREMLIQQQQARRQKRARDEAVAQLQDRTVE
jgi:structural maintenance of chromosome 4